MRITKALIPVTLLLSVLLWDIGAETDVTRLKALGFQVPSKRSPAISIRVLGEEDGNTLVIPDAGTVTLINFWASWCPPCRSEMPSLNRLYHALKEEGLHLAAINLNEEIPLVQDYLHSAALDLPVYYFPEKEALNIYKLRGIPSSFLVDKNGMVAAALIGSTEWDHPMILRTIRELMEEP